MAKTEPRVLRSGVLRDKFVPAVCLACVEVGMLDFSRSTSPQGRGDPSWVPNRKLAETAGPKARL